MWASLKTLPLMAKLGIAFMLVVGLYVIGLADRPSHARGGYTPASYHGDSGGQFGGDSNGSNDSNDQSRALGQFKAQQQQLMAQVYQCEAQMNQATQQMAQAAMNGGMVNNRPQCEQYMPQWTAQEAYLETEIYRIQTGDHKSTVRQITGITGPTNSAPSAGGDDGTGAVENWDRQAIRGNSLYTDESGQTHELPTRPYYFRDRSSGQIIGSDSPNAPNDGRDYEQFTGQD
jgi:hypothetical protein